MEYASILLIPIVHELGHYVAARLCGSRLSFHFSWGILRGIPIPRWVWYWPDVTKNQLRIICLAGFGLELGIAPFMPLPYQVAAVVHLVVYPFYAGEMSDWKGVM